MTQNVYDDEGFFAAYSQLRRSVLGLAGAPEWPTLQGLLPEIEGRRVADLGCGFGWFCRWAASQGAASVLGIDVSARMLERARAETDDDRITYQQADLDLVELRHPTFDDPGFDRTKFDAPGFDVVYSSLTLHYLVDLDRLLAEVGRSLGAGGCFVFSVEHPLFTAPSRPEFVTGPAGRPVWPLDRYLDEGQRTTDWLAPGVRKQHRTIATYLAALRRAGLRLDELIEWGPSAAQIAEFPDWQLELDRPPFLLIRALRHPG